MALSRPFVLAVIGALLAVATFASMRSAAERAEADDTANAPTVQRAPAATTPVKPAAPAPLKPEASKKKPNPSVNGVPPKLAKALEARKLVVLFFRQPAADDAATAEAVKSVRGIKGVAVFSAPITKLARYRRVVSGLGVTQAPAVVVVGKDREAQLTEGYIDALTLRQQVKDAR